MDIDVGATIQLKRKPERLLTDKGAAVAGRLCCSKVGGDALWLKLCLGLCFTFAVGESELKKLEMTAETSSSAKWKEYRVIRRRLTSYL